LLDSLKPNSAGPKPIKKNLSTDTYESSNGDVQLVALKFLRNLVKLVIRWRFKNRRVGRSDNLIRKFIRERWRKIYSLSRS
jgi:hypothetical protein